MKNKDSHNYDHTHEHNNNKSTKNIKITFYLNFAFALIECIVAIFSNSIALFSNSIHDFGDSVILFSTLKLEKISSKGRDKDYTYGYRRFTLIGAILNLFILLVGSIIIIYGVVKRLNNPQEIKENIILFFAIIGIFINIIGVYKVSKDKSIVSKSLKKNLLMDVLSWTILLIGAILINLTGFYFIDSLLSLILAFSMIIAVIKDSKEVFATLMQKVPDDIDIEKIKNFILSNDDVLDVHDLHIWSLDGDDYIATFHIVVADNLVDTKIMYIKEYIKNELEKYKINHTTIEVDTKTQAILNKEVPKNIS